MQDLRNSLRSLSQTMQGLLSTPRRGRSVESNTRTPPSSQQRKMISGSASAACSREQQVAALRLPLRRPPFLFVGEGEDKKDEKQAQLPAPAAAASPSTTSAAQQDAEAQQQLLSASTTSTVLSPNSRRSRVSVHPDVHVTHAAVEGGRLTMTRIPHSEHVARRHVMHGGATPMNTPAKVIASKSSSRSTVAGGAVGSAAARSGLGGAGRPGGAAANTPNNTPQWKPQLTAKPVTLMTTMEKGHLDPRHALSSSTETLAGAAAGATAGVAALGSNAAGTTGSARAVKAQQVQVRSVTATPTSGRSSSVNKQVAFRPPDGSDAEYDGSGKRYTYSDNPTVGKMQTSSSAASTVAPLSASSSLGSISAAQLSSSSSSSLLKLDGAPQFTSSSSPKMMRLSLKTGERPEVPHMLKSGNAALRHPAEVAQHLSGEAHHPHLHSAREHLRAAAAAATFSKHVAVPKLAIPRRGAAASGVAAAVPAGSRVSTSVASPAAASAGGADSTSGLIPTKRPMPKVNGAPVTSANPPKQSRQSSGASPIKTNGTSTALVMKVNMNSNGKKSEGEPIVVRKAATPATPPASAAAKFPSPAPQPQGERGVSVVKEVARIEAATALPLSPTSVEKRAPSLEDLAAHIDSQFTHSIFATGEIDKAKAATSAGSSAWLANPVRDSSPRRQSQAASKEGDLLGKDGMKDSIEFQDVIEEQSSARVMLRGAIGEANRTAGEKAVLLAQAVDSGAGAAALTSSAASLSSSSSPPRTLISENISKSSEVFQQEAGLKTAQSGTMSPNKGKMTGLSTPSPLGSPKQTRFAEPQSGDEIVLLVKEPAPSDHDASAAKSRIVTLPGGGGGIVPPASPTSRAPVATMQGNDSDFGMGQRLLRTPPRTPPGVLRTPRTPPDAQPSPTAGGLARVAMSMATPPPTRLRGEGETETGIVSSGGGAAAATFDMRIVEAIQSIGDKLDRSIRDSVDAMAQSLSPSTSPMMRSRIGVAAGEVVEAGKKTSSVLLAGGAKEQNSGAAAASATRRSGDTFFSPQDVTAASSVEFAGGELLGRDKSGDRSSSRTRKTEDARNQKSSLSLHDEEDRLRTTTTTNVDKRPSSQRQSRSPSVSRREEDDSYSPRRMGNAIAPDDPDLLELKALWNVSFQNSPRFKKRPLRIDERAEQHRAKTPSPTTPTRNKGGRNVSLNAGVSSARGGSRTRASKNLRAQQYSVLNESAIPRTREDESMMEVDMTLIDQLNTSNVVAAGSSPPGSMSATQQEGVQRRRASSNGSSNKKESSDKSPGVDMGKKEKAPPDAVDQTFAVAPVSSRGNRYGGRIRANDPDLLALKQAWAPFRLRPLAANRGAAAQQGDQVVVTHGDSPYKKRAGSGSGGGGAVVGYNTNKNVGNNSISPEKKQAWQPDSKPGPTFTEDDKEDGGGFVFYKEANAPSLVIDEGASTSVVVDAIVPQKKVQAVAEQINVNVFEDAQDGDENQNDAQPHVDEQHSPVEPIPSVDSKLFGPLSGSEVAPDGVVGPSVLSNSAEAAALAAASGYSMDEQEGSSSSFEELQDGNIVTPALIESMFSAHTSKSSTITQQPGLGGTAGAAAAKKLAIPEQVVQRLRNRAAAVAAAAAERERQRAIEHAEKQALMSGGAPAAPVSVSSSSARANSSGAAGRSSVRGNHATAFGAPNTTSASLRMRSSSATRTAAATSVGGVTEVEVRRRNGGAPYKVSPRKANQKNSSSMLMSTSFQVGGTGGRRSARPSQRQNSCGATASRSLNVSAIAGEVPTSAHGGAEPGGPGGSRRSFQPPPRAAGNSSRTMHRLHLQAPAGNSPGVPLEVSVIQHYSAAVSPNQTGAPSPGTVSSTRPSPYTQKNNVLQLAQKRRHGAMTLSEIRASKHRNKEKLPSASEVKQKQARERREHIQNAQENLLRNRVANQETKREVIEMDRSLLLERARMMASRPGRSRSVGATAKRSPVTPNMSVQDSNFFPWACKSISQTHDSLQLSGVDPR